MLRRHGLAGQQYLARLAQKHGKGKALTILAHKFARAVYDMLKRNTAFDEEIDAGVWNVYCGPLKLGRLLERHMRIEDAYVRLKRHR